MLFADFILLLVRASSEQIADYMPAPLPGIPRSIPIRSSRDGFKPLPLSQPHPWRVPVGELDAGLLQGGADRNQWVSQRCPTIVRCYLARRFVGVDPVVCCAASGR